MAIYCVFGAEGQDNEEMLKECLLNLSEKRQNFELYDLESGDWLVSSSMTTRDLANLIMYETENPPENPKIRHIFRFLVLRAGAPILGLHSPDCWEWLSSKGEK